MLKVKENSKPVTTNASWPTDLKVFCEMYNIIVKFKFSGKSEIIHSVQQKSWLPE
jgi:hypothetical protein